MDKKYVVIITEEDEKYDKGETDLSFYANNPWKGLLRDIINGNTFNDLYGNGDNEGLFYQLYSTETGERIGSGTFDPDAPREEIAKFEAKQIERDYKNMTAFQFAKKYYS